MLVSGAIFVTQAKAQCQEQNVTGEDILFII